MGGVSVCTYAYHTLSYMSISSIFDFTEELLQYPYCHDHDRLHKPLGVRYLLKLLKTVPELHDIYCNDTVPAHIDIVGDPHRYRVLEPFT